MWKVFEKVVATTLCPHDAEEMRHGKVLLHCTGMHILALVAGTNVPSNSETLADVFLRGVEETDGITVEKVRIKDFPLPHFTLDCYKENCPIPEEYRKLKALVEGADGILIATPIWNFGVPAHLKNLIDWMGCFALDAETRTRGQLQGKPFYFIFTGGAPVPAWKGLMRFTTMFVPEALRYYRATIVGKHFEGKCTIGKGVFGLVVDKRPESLARVRSKGAAFGIFVKRFKETGKLPVMHRFVEWAYKRGQHLISRL